jgi:hypothetical protein
VFSLRGRDMSVINPQLASQLINIKISPPLDQQQSTLRLSYQDQSYTLIQAFVHHKVDRAERKLHQLRKIDRQLDGINFTDRYLLIREEKYFSLWEVSESSSVKEIAEMNDNVDPASQVSQNLASSHQLLPSSLAFQQASIWLFQELWLQWQELLGPGQVEVFAKNLLMLVPQVKSAADLDQLLALDPLNSDQLAAHFVNWSQPDLAVFDRQLYQLTQKKMGQQFGTKLTLEIIESMPTNLRSVLLEILDIN